MATINSIITNNGVEQAILAQAEFGFFVKISSFGISETAGALDVTRTTGNAEWYKSLISSAQKIDSNTIQINCHIPPNSVDLITGLPVTGTRSAAEIYLYALDENDDEYLFAIGQPDFTELYSVAAALTFRMEIKLTNSNVDNIYQFLYTQANEISDHNNDPNAHPDIQDALSKHGVYVQQLNREYKGQQVDAFANVDPSVNDLDAVYWDNAEGKYKTALFNDTLAPERQNCIGVYLADKNSVVFSGLIDFAHTYAPYTNLFLSPDNDGEYSDAITTVRVAYAMPDNKIFIAPTDVDKLLQTDGGGAAAFTGTQENHGFEALQAIYFDGGNIDPAERKWKVAKADNQDTLGIYLVTEFNETLPDDFTAAKFGRFSYEEQILKAQGEFYYLSPDYGVDMEVLNLFPAAVTVQGYVGISLNGLTIEERAENLANDLNALNANFRAKAIGSLVHFETDTSLTITSTDQSILKTSLDATKAGYGTPFAPTTGYDNPLFYVEDRNSIHALMHRPTVIGGAGNSPTGIGIIEQWPTGLANVPYGTLYCDGSIYKQDAYSELFSVIGTTYNTGGEAADEFRVPNEPTITIGTTTFNNYIRYTHRAIWETDLVGFNKNFYGSFGTAPASVTGNESVDTELYRFFKTEINIPTQIIFRKLRPGRKFHLSVKNMAAGAVDFNLVPDTDYEGVSSIETHFQAGVETTAGNKIVNFASGEEKLFKFECFYWANVMHVYITAGDFL